MSVINQMLRDLDARGQRDGAARRAAMASVGRSPATRRDGRRGLLLRWWGVGLCLALASAALLVAADRWRAEASVDALMPDAALVPRPAVPGPVTPPPALPTPAVAEPPASPTSTPTPPPTRPIPAAPPNPSSPMADSASSMQRAAEAAPSAPDPVPPARASIERLAPEGDPLDVVRDALAEGRADEALAALATLPGHGAARDALEAAALQALGRHADAEPLYRRALRQEPDVAAWWAGLGISLDAAGRGPEALEAFREAQRRGPLDPALTDYLGERVEALSAGEPSR